MTRSTKDDWLYGPGDLAEEEVQDVPVPGASVRVRALSARYTADVMSQTKLEQDGRGGQIAKIDVAAMERLQFMHGVIEPEFSEEEVSAIQERMGPSFRKVVNAIDGLSGIDKEAVKDAEQRFPAGGSGSEGAGVGAAGSGDADAPAGNGGPAVSARTGA